MTGAPRRGGDRPEGRRVATEAPRRGRWRNAAHLAVVALLSCGLALNIGLLRRAGHQLDQLSVGAMGLLALGAIAYRALQSVLLAGSLRNLTWRRAVIASEAYTGCSNSMVGGGALGTGVKAAMLRSWGIDNSAIATSMTVTAIVPTVAMWTLALLYTSPEVLAGTASTNQTVVALGAIGALGVQLTFWSVALVHPPLARRIADVIAAVARRVAPRCRGPLRPLQRPLQSFDPHGLASRMRHEGRQIARNRALRLFVVGLSSQLCLSFVLIVALWGLGGHQASLVEILQAFTMARVAASFVPIPGGLGVLDVGLFTGLVHAGVSPSVVMAALVLYRASTYALPILTGCGALLWWRRARAAAAADSTATVRELPSRPSRRAVVAEATTELPPRPAAA